MHLAALLAVGANPARLAVRASAIAVAGMFHVEHRTLEFLFARMLGRKASIAADASLAAPHRVRRFLKKLGERVRTTLDVRCQEVASDTLKYSNSRV